MKQHPIHLPERPYKLDDRHAPTREVIYALYQRRRKRQQRRLMLLLSVLTGLALFISSLTWWLLRPVEAGLPVETGGVRAALEQYFGPIRPASALYPKSVGFEESIYSAQQQPLAPLPVASEDLTLKAQIETLLATFPAGHFEPYLYFFNPATGQYVSIHGNKPVHAASVIKLPVLLAYLQALDESRLQPESPLLYLPYHQAGGAGILQYQPPGGTLPSLYVAQEMIRISDNTATNMLIDALGGFAALNQQFVAWGLRETHLQNWLPDLGGTNSISPYEMVTLLHNLQLGWRFSQNSRDLGLQTLTLTRNNRLLPALLPKDSVIAHKTGDIGTALGDSGIVYLPDGRYYILSFHVHRPYNDYTAREAFQQVSALVYRYITQQGAALDPAARGR